MYVRMPSACPPTETMTQTTCKNMQEHTYIHTRSTTADESRQTCLMPFRITTKVCNLVGANFAAEHTCVIGRFGIFTEAEFLCVA